AVLRRLALGQRDRRLPGRAPAELGVRAGDVRPLDREDLHLLHVPAADPLVSPPLPVGSAAAPGLAAPAADLDRERRGDGAGRAARSVLGPLAALARSASVRLLFL